MRARTSLPTAYRLQPTAFGFTLIEILVVVVIIAVMVSAAAVAVTVLGRDTEVQDQTKRLWAVLNQAKEEAELQSRNFGLLIDATGYEFVEFDARRWAWEPLVDDELLRPRTLPPGVSMALKLEGREVVLKPRAERKGTAASGAPADSTTSVSLADADLAPHIMLLASGDVNSFDVRIEREGADYSWHVHSKPDNSIEFGEVDANL